MNFFAKFLFLFSLQNLCAAPTWSAINLSKTWEWHARKMNITVQPIDLEGKYLSAIPLNQVVKLRVDIEALDRQPINDLQLVKFDALMPAHRHGMVTKAHISEVGSHQYLIEGVKLHMPGVWSLFFDMKTKSEAAQVAILLNL